MFTERAQIAGAQVNSKTVMDLIEIVRQSVKATAKPLLPLAEQQYKESTGQDPDESATDENPDSGSWSGYWLDIARRKAESGGRVTLKEFTITTPTRSQNWTSPAGSHEDFDPTDLADLGLSDQTDGFQARFETEHSSDGHGFTVHLQRSWPMVAIKIHSSFAIPDDLVPALSICLERTVTDEFREQQRRGQTVFIGHGGDSKWEVLQDALTSNGYTVEAFESQDRTGGTTFDTVYQMIRSAHVAVIVLTAAETLKDGTKQARPNVVHEIGLAQGLLGPERTIIVKEKSVKEFTNISGINQIWAPDGDLHSVKRAILDAVDRRFGDKRNTLNG